MVSGTSVAASSTVIWIINGYTDIAAASIVGGWTAIFTTYVCAVGAVRFAYTLVAFVSCWTSCMAFAAVQWMCVEIDALAVAEVFSGWALAFPLDTELTKLADFIALSTVTGVLEGIDTNIAAIGFSRGAFTFASHTGLGCRTGVLTRATIQVICLKIDAKKSTLTFA